MSTDHLNGDLTLFCSVCLKCGRSGVVFYSGIRWLQMLRQKNHLPVGASGIKRCILPQLSMSEFRMSSNAELFHLRNGYLRQHEKNCVSLVLQLAPLHFFIFLFFVFYFWVWRQTQVIKMSLSLNTKYCNFTPGVYLKHRHLLQTTVQMSCKPYNLVSSSLLPLRSVALFLFIRCSSGADHTHQTDAACWSL